MGREADFISSINTVRIQFNTGKVPLGPALTRQIEAAFDKLTGDYAIGKNPKDYAKMIGKLTNVSFKGGTEISQVILGDITPPDVKTKFEAALGPVEIYLMNLIAKRLGINFYFAPSPSVAAPAPAQHAGAVMIVAPQQQSMTPSSRPYAAGPDYVADPQERLRQKMENNQMIERETDAVLGRIAWREDIRATENQIDIIGATTRENQRLQAQLAQQRMVEEEQRRAVQLGDIQTKGEVAIVGLFATHASNLNAGQALLQGQQQTQAAANQQYLDIMANMQRPTINSPMGAAVAMPQVVMPAGYQPTMYASMGGAQPVIITQPGAAMVAQPAMYAQVSLSAQAAMPAQQPAAVYKR